MNTHFDVIIIGTGAGGGTLAYALADSGKRILLLERGPYMPREKDNWNPRAVVLDGKYNPGEKWKTAGGEDFAPGVKYAVGGNTKVYGAALLRLRPSDFNEIRHEGGISSAWPISYDEWEPWYAAAEQLYRVRGKHGSDFTCGPTSRDYPFGAIRHEKRTEKLVADFERIGLKPWPLPLGLLLNDEHPEADACVRCDTCDGFPCLVKGKADAQVICVEPALQHANVTMITDAKVQRLETDLSGKSVRNVVVEILGERKSFSADLVVVSCGALNSAALLLRSVSEKHPNGLGNSSGLLGRNYMAHQNSAVFALSSTENRTVLQKTWALSDFYGESKAWDFPMGLIQPLNRTPVEILEAWPPGIDGDYTSEYLATHSLEFWLTTEDLATTENRVTLDENGAIRVSYTRNNTVAHERLIEQLGKILEQVEGPTFKRETHYRPQVMPIGVNSHQCGTARFGPDPKTSVLDLNCKAHDLDNLYVVDASFFPSSGAVNPSLTIISNALRVAGHLRERMR